MEIDIGDPESGREEGMRFPARMALDKVRGGFTNSERNQQGYV